ncbi:MAG: sensor domain-containing diguanylate cyclase [Trueperaceae bacterium]|nr:sensor domain-containing diguanylate cyclase [Trueperaceae bacterium]
MTTSRRTDAPDPAQLRVIYERMTDGILVVDDDGVILEANPAALRMLPGGHAGLKGASFGFPIADRNAVVIELLSAGGAVRTAEMRVSDLEWCGQPARLLILRDITEQTDLLQRLHRAANYDPVTGLPNRMLFLEHINQAIREAHRHGHRVGLLFVDFDGFKRVNDTYGHAVGDRLLRQIGDRLTQVLRAGDSVARFAGDEFLVTLTQVKDVEEASIVARKVLTAFDDPFELDDRVVVTTSASIGVAFFPDDAADASELLRRSDAAMYRAKAEGGHRFFVHGAG